MTLRAWNVAVLGAAVATWLACGTQRERPVVEQANADAVHALESNVAAHPADAASSIALAQAYLDSKNPGLAVSVLESAPAAVRADVRVEHAYARALVAQGRNQDALVAERQVLATCASGSEPCDGFLLVSAQRRADILQELVKLGVEDAQAHPEASQIAYYNATRTATVAVLQ
jgi:predicted Zn-dependent protease